MTTSRTDFKIEYLDHVAIRVSDMKVSVAWYRDVLRLKKYQFEEWGDFPIFMLQGKTGIAIFPTKSEEDGQLTASKIRIDHFAFYVSNESFHRAQQYFKEIDVPFEFQDHTFHHSIYLKDPDGHTVELTTLIVSESDFYANE